jgi:hypothetical protein
MKYFIKILKKKIGSSTVEIKREISLKDYKKEIGKQKEKCKSFYTIEKAEEIANLKNSKRISRYNFIKIT